jgi:hypothetical protein
MRFGGWQTAAVRALAFALLLAGALAIASHTGAGAQILPTTTSTSSPILTTTTVPSTTTTSTVATTAPPATVAPVATTSTAPKPTTTASTFVPPEGQNGPTTTIARPPTKEAGGAVLPLLVTLSIGGFALVALIMGAQWFATRPPK